MNITSRHTVTRSCNWCLGPSTNQRQGTGVMVMEVACARTPGPRGALQGVSPLPPSGCQPAGQHHPLSYQFCPIPRVTDSSCHRNLAPPHPLPSACLGALLSGYGMEVDGSSIHCPAGGTLPVGLVCLTGKSLQECSCIPFPGVKQ